MDWLEQLKEIKDDKDAVDLVNEVLDLDTYYNNQQFEAMSKHINKLTKKYAFETLTWNTLNRDMPTTYNQAYINARNFLQAKALKMVVEKLKK